MTDDGLEPQVDGGLETLMQNQDTEYHGAAHEEPHTVDPSKGIAGLTTRAFWVVIAVISLVVIGVTIGGSVGGTAAVRAKSW